MWLLHAQTIQLKYFHDQDAFKKGYAILSHTWDQEEVTFQDIKSLDSARRMKGFEKIQLTCQQAIRDGLDYVWVDTCCIDKTSSAELSEAINSMFKWYQKAKICYAYLSDVPIEGNDHPLAQAEWLKNLHVAASADALAQSKWFTRGWTLQELIAPRTMKFFGQAWKFCGTKTSMAPLLAKITQIDRRILLDVKFLSEACVAKKLSWAAHRQTTRVEDRAYCLLGLMNINIPLLYGEGEGAFARLQREIVRTSTDHSVLLWHYTNDVNYDDLENHLALSPREFQHAKKITQWTWRRPMPMELTSIGLHLSLPTLDFQGKTYAVLNCHYEDDFSGPIGLPLSLLGQGETDPWTMVRVKRTQRPLYVSSNRFPTIPFGKHESAMHQTLLIPSRWRNFEPHADSSDTRRNVSILLDFGTNSEFCGKESLVCVGPQQHWNQRTCVLEWPDHDDTDEIARGYLVWEHRPACYFVLLLCLTRPSKGARLDTVFFSKIMWSANRPLEEQMLSSGLRLCSRRVSPHTQHMETITPIDADGCVHLHAGQQMIMGAPVCIVKLRYVEKNYRPSREEDWYQRECHEDPSTKYEDEAKEHSRQ